MTVLQRMREIGTLRALGASDVRVARSILVEAVVLALAGSVARARRSAPGSRCCSCEAMQSLRHAGLDARVLRRAPSIAALVTGPDRDARRRRLAGACAPARMPPDPALIGAARGRAAR